MSDSSQQQRAEALFHQARELPDDARSAFLDSACADDAALRREVDALLNHDRGSFLADSPLPKPNVMQVVEREIARALQRPDDELPAAFAELRARYPQMAHSLHQHERTVRERAGDAAAAPAADRPTRPAGSLDRGSGAARSPDPIPERIGPYRLLEQLGEGGMGTVYLAEQREPVRRRVALKLIKLGMDTKSVLARFEAERQAISLMDHPNITRVLDAGSTPDGRPYFAMDLVHGIPITEYADKHRVETAARLELFVQVCRGIQHAHQKGIIHRDIKPSNVLVQLQDGQPVPKIIDFGVAKAVDRRLTEKTLWTLQGQIIGTPEYMSPEQAEMSSLNVDTRTDVYSLGVLLYELLTGELPFASRDLREGGYLEIQRKLREDEPAKPSLRVTTRGGDSRDRAVLRHTDIAGLARQLRGDLDWITMKALEKDRTLRYQTASELAADVDRFLAGLPVEAGPPSAIYRLRKCIRRYRVQFAAGGAVLLALIGGLIVSTVFYQQTEAARKDEAAARALAELRRQDAERALDRFDLLRTRVELDRAKSDAAALYPAWPDRVDAMRRFVEQHARPLRARRPVIEAAVHELRTRPTPALARTPERTPAPDSQVTATKAGLGTDAGIAQPAPDASTPRVPAHPDDVERFLLDTLLTLRDDLDEFLAPVTGVADDVQRRLSWAEGLAERSIDRHRERWQQAIDAIRESRHYRGLALTPQLGLVPIGMDPQSTLWEFAHLRSGEGDAAIPQRNPDDGTLQITPDTGLVFVLVPSAMARIGAQRSDPDAPHHDPAARSNEGPVEEVFLDAFFVSKFEMSQQQWFRLSDGNPPIPREPSHFQNGTPSAKVQGGVPFAVEQVSWHACVELLRRHGLLLPTEAQWEYAARGGEDTPWWTGGEAAELQTAANLADQSAKAVGMVRTTFEPWDDGFPLAPVFALRPNPFGLHNVHGNVWEWCRDAVVKKGERVPRRSGDGLRRSGHDERCYRGGSYADLAVDARSAALRYNDGAHVSSTIGVRPVRRVLPSGAR